jgi:hypothetical protein
VQAIEDLLLDWWNDFGLSQKAQGQRVYRALATYWLAQFHLGRGDRGTAFRWLLYSQADDVLDGGEGGAVRDLLDTEFGMSDAVRETITRIAQECSEQAEVDWSQPCGFPEEIVRRFIEYDPAYFMSRASLAQEFPLSKAYYQTLLERAVNIIETKASTAVKEQMLEDLAFYLLTLLPGCVPRRDLMDGQAIGEEDMVVHNVNQVADVMTDLVGRSFLVECSNRKSTLDIQQIGYFLYRMRLSRMRFGVIFSMAGLSRTKKRADAIQELIRRAFREDNLLCVIVNGDDLQTLAVSENASFWTMLLGKMEQSRFG